MSYKLYVSKEVRVFLDALDEKSRRIVIDNLRKVEQNPFPGQGIGDKEKLMVDGENIYRLHIGRTYTAFYIITDNNNIRVLEITSIDEAHEKYGFG